MPAVVCAETENLARKYLEGLRQRGWHDVALEYLESAEEDPLVNEDFLEKVNYEKAILLAEIAGKTLTDSEKGRLFKQAISLFQEYAESNRDSMEYFEAMGRATKMLAEQARGKVARANRLPTGASQQREPLLLEARTNFEEAAGLLEELLDSCRKKLESLPQGAMTHLDPATPSTREKVRVIEAESRFLSANLLFEKADTFSANSKQYQDVLEQAAAKFARLHEDYEDSLIDYLGRLYQGRCYQSLGRWDEALESYEELIGEPVSKPKFRRLVARAYRRRAECFWEKGDLPPLIDECNDWLRDAKGKELKQPEWLAVAFRLAEALDRQSDAEKGNEKSRLQSEARQLMREVSLEPGEFQSAAKAALAASGSVEAVDPVEASSFAEAFEAGKQALEQMSSANLAAELAAENNPAAEPDLRVKAQQHRLMAEQMFRAAAQLADNQTAQEDLLSAQYFLCWLYWEEERLHEAAVLGEFIARKNSESSYAANAAKIAIRAYDRLLQEARRSGDATYETQKLGSMAELMARRWPDSPEAGAAVNMLVQIAINEQRIDDAKQLLQRLPEDNRAAAELKLATTMWSLYLQAARVKSVESQQAAAEWKQQAASHFASGYKSLRKAGAVSVPEATALIYYVNLLLSDGQANNAIEVLENPKVGPLAVIDADKLDIQPTFAQETYRVGLRAYVAVSPPRRQEAQRMMAALEESIGKGPGAAQKLARVYLGIGVALQKRMKELADQGQDNQAEEVARAFEALLQRITKLGDSQEWEVRQWIAQTNLQLAEEMPAEEASAYRERAQQVLQSMLREAEENPNRVSSPNKLLGVRKLLGDCLLAQEEYSAAYEQYQDILRQAPNLLQLQRSTALMLQQWGFATRDSERLNQAVRGALPQANKKNLIWGWLRLAEIANQTKQRVAESPEDVAKYEDLFFEARLNVAKARLYAARISDGAQRKKHLQSARTNVKSMQRLYPNLGGPKWQRAFDELLSEIEAEG